IRRTSIGMKAARHQGSGWQAHSRATPYGGCVNMRQTVSHSAVVTRRRRRSLTPNALGESRLRLVDQFEWRRFAMAKFLIAGSIRSTGAQPDGDSIRFTPGDPAKWDLITAPTVLNGTRAVRPS